MPVLVVALLVGLTGCTSPSPQGLQHRLSALPGVADAVARTDGDDDIPFDDAGEVYANVVLEGGATADEVRAVLDQLVEADIATAKVQMAGPKSVMLELDGSLDDRRHVAEDLVAACDDAEVLSYQREAFSWWSSVSVQLSTADFDHVVAAADRYGDAGNPEEVHVTAGRFRIARDRANDPALTDARIRFVQRVDDEFRVTGAVVSGRAPLELWATWKRRDALRAFVAGDPEAQGLGPVVVRTASIPWS